MSKSALEYLRHIRDEARVLMDIVRDSDFDSFVHDAIRTRAATRSIEIIGEASKQISEDFRSQHPEIEWSRMARMRDRLIHGYFHTDYAIVWEVMVSKAPEILRNIDAILNKDTQDHS
jgi:uncharacterized protein with HEPN domain